MPGSTLRVANLAEGRGRRGAQRANVIAATLAHSQPSTQVTTAGWQTILRSWLPVVPSVVIMRERQEEPELPEGSVFEATLAQSRSSTQATAGGW